MIVKSQRCLEVRGKYEVQRSGLEVQIKSRRFRVRSKVSDQGSELQGAIKGFRSKDRRVGIIE